MMLKLNPLIWCIRLALYGEVRIVDGLAKSGAPS